MKTYFVYLDNPYGKELIGSGSLDTCQRIKTEKDKEWQRGDMWSTHITDKQEKEYTMFD